MPFHTGNADLHDVQTWVGKSEIRRLNGAAVAAHMSDATLRAAIIADFLCGQFVCNIAYLDAKELLRFVHDPVQQDRVRQHLASSPVQAFLEVKPRNECGTYTLYRVAETKLGDAMNFAGVWYPPHVPPTGTQTTVSPTGVHTIAHTCFDGKVLMGGGVLHVRENN